MKLVQSHQPFDVVASTIERMRPSSTLATVNRPFPSKWGWYQATLASRIHPCGGDFSACCLHAQRPSTLVTASRWQPRSAPLPYCASRQVLASHLVFSFTVLAPLFFQFHPFAGGLAALPTRPMAVHERDGPTLTPDVAATPCALHSDYPPGSRLAVEYPPGWPISPATAASELV
jgi:hypothetical protein